MNRSSVSLPRSLSRLGVVVLVALTALAASITVATVASAHVTVSSQDAAPGGYGKLTFRVPNESDAAFTVGVRIQIPEEAALASVSTQPVPGWTATLTTTDLEQPIENHGQEISSYVSVVEFRATDGGFGPGQFQEFALSGGPFPDAESLSFPTVQRYSDGTESAWIEPTLDGQGEPEHPAPTVSLVAADTPATDGAAAPEAATDDHAHASVSDSPGGLALFLSIVALLGAIAATVLGVRANRRNVSS
jgi:periplasmic copper chaperone A